WEQSLRDKERIVQRSNVVNDPKLTGLTLRFNEQVVLVPADGATKDAPRTGRSADAKVARPPARPAKPASVAPTSRATSTSGGKP
ncbi:MAG TPA: hypothetical protein VFB96_11415, partial [Pirellulaceae bacterium]|nr:hypothetical protein [Pirellulaceae bacterium]